jgi:hypothetical protein
VLGRTTGLGAAWRAGRIGAVLAAAGLLVLLVVGPLVLLVVVVVVLALAHLTPLAVLIGIFGSIGAVVFEPLVWVRLSLTMPAMVLEQVSPVAAIRRSWQLSRGSFWRLFGIRALTFIIVTVAAYVLTIPFAIGAVMIGGGSLNPFGAAATASLTALIIVAIGGIVAATVTRPISAGVNALLYLDLRMRREGLDLTLRDAAQKQALSGEELPVVFRPPAPGQGAPGAW